MYVFKVNPRWCCIAGDPSQGGGSNTAGNRGESSSRGGDGGGFGGGARGTGYTTNAGAGRMGYGKSPSEGGSFLSDLSRIGSYLGKTISNDLSMALEGVKGLPGEIADALGLGPKAKDQGTVDTAFGPMSTDMTAVNKPNVDPAKLGQALSGLGRLATNDEIDVVTDVMVEAGLISPSEKAALVGGKIAGQLVGTAVSPLAALAAQRLGVNMMNPAAQNTIGAFTDTIGGYVGRAANMASLDSIGRTGGISAPEGAVSGMMGGPGGTGGGGPGERQQGMLSGKGLYDSFTASLHRGMRPTAQNAGQGQRGPAPGVETGRGAARRMNSRAGGYETIEPGKAPMTSKQKGSRLGLGDYFTLTSKLGVGNEPLELRNRVLGGA